MPAAKFEIVRKCKVCGELFKAKTIESWYCSPRCSKIAWKRNKDEELRMQKLDEVVKKIPKSKDYITVPEAYALFGISKETLYRLIRKGVISSVNVGERQIRLSKEELLKLYPLRKKVVVNELYKDFYRQVFLRTPPNIIVSFLQFFYLAYNS